MRYRKVAGSDIEISDVGFGTWTLATSWWGEHSDEEAVALLREAASLGITFYDAADTYGNGRGETVLAQAFPGAEREKIVIGTKFGYDWKSRPKEQEAGHQEAPHNWSPEFLENALHDSLERLGTDYIDIYQLHNPRLADLDQDHVWTFLDKAREAGKIRAAGVALGPAIGWLEEGVYAMHERGVKVVQIIYNALELDPGRGLIAAARETDSSLLVRVPHSSGMLEGTYTKDTVFPKSDHRSHRPKEWLINGLKKIEQLDFLYEAGGKPNGGTLGQAALRWVVREREVINALPNIYNREQLLEFVAAADRADVTDEEAARVEALYDANYGLERVREAGLAPAREGSNEAGKVETR